ncbi:MAG: aldo/keto reductase, partial [Ignavibacteriae bacterium]|nr:aldo/keto reductase [Ignavibacteriota bacterium]
LKGYEWLKERLESEAGKKQIEKTIKLEKIANELDCTLSQLAIAWCLVNPNVSTVITGASKSQQVKSIMKSLDIVSKLTTDVLIEIEQILDNKPNWPFDWRNM